MRFVVMKERNVSMLCIVVSQSVDRRGVTCREGVQRSDILLSEMPVSVLRRRDFGKG